VDLGVEVVRRNGPRPCHWWSASFLRVAWLVGVVVLGACSGSENSQSSTSESDRGSVPTTEQLPVQTTVSGTTATTTGPVPTTTDSSDISNGENLAGGDSEPGDTDFEVTGASDGWLCEPAPVGTVSVLPLPPWSTTRERVFELRTSREENGQADAARSFLGSADLRVTPIADGGWSFVWENGSSLADDLGFSDLPTGLARDMQGVSPLRVRYRLRSDRVWLGVDNIDEILVVVEGVFDVLGRLLSSTDEVRPMREGFARMSLETLGEAFSQEAQALHTLEGIEFTLDESVEFRTELLNPFGERSIPATASFKLVELVDGEGCVVVQLSIVPDAEELAELLVEISGLDGLDGTELDDLLGTFSYETRTVGQYDFGTGFFRTIAVTQRVSIDGEERVEVQVITDATDR